MPRRQNKLNTRTKCIKRLRLKLLLMRYSEDFKGVLARIEKFSELFNYTRIYQESYSYNRPFNYVSVFQESYSCNTI